MKAVQVFSETEFNRHKAAGHDLEFTDFAEDGIDLPRCDAKGSEGWISVNHASWFDSATGKFRAWVPDDCSGFPEPEESTEYLDEGVAATDQHEYEVSTEHGHDTLLDELADIACRYGITVEFDIRNGVVTFNPYA